MAGGAQVVVDTRLDRAEILIGERATLSATVTADAGSVVKLPDFDERKELTPGVEVLSAQPVDTTSLNGGRRMQLTRNYLITSFDSAVYALPPLEVLVDGEVHRSRSLLGLKVVTVPVDTLHVDQFAPPFYVLESPFKWLAGHVGFGSAIWGIIIAIFILAIFLTRRKPLCRRVVIKPPVPPFKRAATAMAALEPQVSTAVSDADNKRFFVELTDILRLYISTRFGFNATESTTAEILGELSESIDVANERTLCEIFTMADAVKFAKQTANDVERRRYFAMAKDFLTSTRDEVLERPKPEVRLVAYSAPHQRRIRQAFWLSLFLLALGGVTFFVWQVLDVWNAYL